MDRIIRQLNEAKRKHQGSKRFNARKPLRLKYVHTEPVGWPLTRPATRQEWAHVIKAMIMRRVPVMQPIHKLKLLHYVAGDITSASDGGRLYVDPDFTEMRRIYILAEQMVRKDRTLRFAGEMLDPEWRFRAPAVYRTEHAKDWLTRVPAVVNAVLDYLPTTNALDLMVQALLDAEVDPPLPDQSPS